MIGLDFRWLFFGCCHLVWLFGWLITSSLRGLPPVFQHRRDRPCRLVFVDAGTSDWGVSDQTTLIAESPSIIKRVSQRQNRFHFGIPTALDRSAHRVRAMKNEPTFALRSSPMLDDGDAGLARHNVPDGISAADATGQFVFVEAIF